MCANDDCSKGAAEWKMEEPFSVTAHTQCTVQGGGPNDSLVFVGLATGGAPWVPKDACPAAATGGRCGLVCYAATDSGCMQNLNHAVANPSIAFTDPKSGCMFLAIGINKMMIFAATPAPAHPPPPSPPPQCLKLSGATCPEYYGFNYDGVFKLDGVFADGTPYYSRTDNRVYLFWQVG